MSRGAQFKSICDDLYMLWKTKDAGYGSENLYIFGEVGILIRCFDKIMRLKSGLWDKVGGLADETLEDTWRDLAVYAIRALMIRQEGHDE